MAQKGTYGVNNVPRRKDTSFRSFICALLVFLALCIAIFLILMFVSRQKHHREENPKDQVEVVEKNDKSRSDKLTVVKVPDKEKEIETTTDYRKPTTRSPTTRRPTTRRPTTVRTPSRVTVKSRIDSGKYLIEPTSTTENNDVDNDIEPKWNASKKTPVYIDRNKESSTDILSYETTEESFTSTSDDAWPTKQYTAQKTPVSIDKSLEITSDVWPQETTSETSTLISNENTSFKPTVTSEEETTFNYVTKWFYQNTLKAVNQQPTTESVLQFTSTEDDSLFMGDTENSTVDTGVDHRVFHFENETTETPKKFTKDGQDVTTEVTDLPSTNTLHKSPRRYYKFFTTPQGNDESYSDSTTENIVSSTTTQSNNGGSTEYLYQKRLVEYGSTTSDIEPTSTETTNGDTMTNTYWKNIKTYTASTENMVTEGERSDTTNVYQQTDDSSKIFFPTDYWEATPRERVRLTSESVTEGAAFESSTRESYTTTTINNILTPQPIKYTATTAPPYHETCNTTECKDASSKLLYLMNHDGDACQDFYDFSCGNHKIDEDQTKKENLEVLLGYLEKQKNITEKYLRDFKTFYQSCVLHERNLAFSQKLEMLFDTPNMTLSELFADLILSQSMPLFDVGLDIDKETKNYIFEFTLPGSSSLAVDIKGWSLLEQIKEECLNRPQRLMSGSDINLPDMYQAFKVCQRERFRDIANNFVEEMAAHPESRNNPIYSRKNMENLFFLIDQIHDLLPSDYEITEVHENKTCGDSQIDILNTTIGYSGVDWHVVFNKLTFSSTLNTDLHVNLYFRNYFLNLFDSLESKFLESELIDALWLYSRLQLYVNTVIPKERNNREMYCIDLSKQLMPDIVSVISYQTYTSQHSTTFKIMQLFNTLKDTLGDSIANSTLMDSAKDTLKKKLDILTLKPVTTGDNHTAVANNKNVNVNERDHQANVMELLKNHRNIIYSLQGTRATAATLLRYFVDPFYDKPKSFYASDIIVVHHAFIRRYISKLPSYINLAQMGMDLSRELAKHFDPIGKNFMTVGNMQSNSYYVDLFKRTKDLLYSYANQYYVIQGRSVLFNVPENLWINQMIADNTAFRLIFNTFSKEKILQDLPWIFHDYPVKKVFFIAAAQEYCGAYSIEDFLKDTYITGNLPPPLRIQNFISNSEEFSDIFECPRGSAMTLPKEVITQFPNIDYSYDYSNIN